MSNLGGGLGIIPKPEFDYTTCATCGVAFGSPVIAFRRNDGKSVWCPNGHSGSWTKTEAAKLREELAAEKQKSWAAEEKARLARELLAKTEKREQRLKKRIANGVCPCCHRTFINIQRHMTTEHPEFKDAQ